MLKSFSKKATHAEHKTDNPAYRAINSIRFMLLFCFGGRRAVDVDIFSASVFIALSSQPCESGRTKKIIFSKYGDSGLVISSICLFTPFNIFSFLSGCVFSVHQIIQIVFENYIKNIQNSATSFSTFFTEIFS